MRLLPEPAPTSMQAAARALDYALPPGHTKAALPSPSPSARTTPTRRSPPSSSPRRAARRRRATAGEPAPPLRRLLGGRPRPRRVRGARARDAEAFKGGMTVKEINAAFGERAGELKKPAKRVGLIDMGLIHLFMM